MEWIHFVNSPIVDFIEGFCLGGSFVLLVLGAIVTSSSGKIYVLFFNRILNKVISFKKECLDFYY